MKVIIVGVFFAILAGVLAEARAVDANSTDVTLHDTMEDSGVTLRNIHIDLQPVERFLNWIFEDKIASAVGGQSPRTFARIRWMGKMFNLVMFLMGMLITMSAGGMMLGMWSVKLGMGVMLLNMAVLLIRLLLTGRDNNNGNGLNIMGMGNGGGMGTNGFNMIPQGRLNFQIFSSQSPVIATVPTMALMGGNMGGSMIPIFGARLPMGTLATGTLSPGNNDRMEFLGNLVGVAPFQQGWQIGRQLSRKK